MTRGGAAREARRSRPTPRSISRSAATSAAAARTRASAPRSRRPPARASEHERSGVVPRRSFLAGLGLAAGGLALGLVRCARAHEPTRAARAAEPGAGFTPNVFVHVAPDGLVTIVCHRSEMGQGVRSSLPVLIADELGADMARVKIVAGRRRQGLRRPEHRRLEQRPQAATRSMRRRRRRRRAMMLVAAAAKRWQRAAGELRGARSRGRPRADEADARLRRAGRRRRQAAGAQAGRRRRSGRRRELRTPRQRAAAPRRARTSSPGARIYRRRRASCPGMLIAVIARPPVVGGKVARFDATRALAVPGVKQRGRAARAEGAVRRSSRCGGVAVRRRQHLGGACAGARRSTITWDARRERALRLGRLPRGARWRRCARPGKVVRATSATSTRRWPSAAQRVEAEYHVPHLAHAPMEPPVGVARVDDGRCEVWASTQNPQAARTRSARGARHRRGARSPSTSRSSAAASAASRSPTSSSRRRSSRSAAGVAGARAVDARGRHPARLLPRGQRAAAGGRARRARQGRRRGVTARRSRRFALDVQPARRRRPTASCSRACSTCRSRSPNVRAESGDATAHVRIGWLRSVCNIFHAFAIGSFIDEIAHARRRDPRDTCSSCSGPPRIVTPAELGVAEAAQLRRSRSTSTPSTRAACATSSSA